MTRNAVFLGLLYSFEADTILFSIYIVLCESGYSCPVISQVHYVTKYNFVQNLWRLANLYIFGKLRV